MAIKTKEQYAAAALDRTENQPLYGCARILAELVEDHPDPAVTSAYFECLTRSVTAEGTFNKVCVKLNTGEMREGTALNGRKCEATAMAAAAFAS